MLDVRKGQSVMDAAVRANLEGIVAECGGSLICATCHVYVQEGAWPAPSDDELAMLEFVAAERRAASRLSCQLPGDEGPGQAVVVMPTHQT